MDNLLLKKGLFCRFLLSFGVVVFLPIAIIGGISYLRSVSRLEQQNEEYLQLIVKDVGSQMDTLIRDYDSVSLYAISQDALLNILKLEKFDYYQKFLAYEWIEKNYLHGIFLRKPYIQGFRIIGNNGFEYSTEDPEISVDAGYYKGKIPLDGTVVVLVNEPGQSDQYVITLGRSVVSYQNLSKLGYLLLFIKPVEFKNIWSQMDLKGSDMWVIGPEGRIIYHPDQTLLGKNAYDFIDPKLLQGDNGRFTSELSGKKQVLVFNTSNYTGWKTVLATPLASFKEPVVDMRNAIMITSLFTFPLSIIIGYLFIFSIIRQIHRIQSTMKEVGKGNFKKIAGKLPDNEIGDLMLTYNQMVQKISDLIEQVYMVELKLQQEALAQQKLELQALQTQINPHFLYNTLGAINAYSLTGEREPIQKMITALSTMFRYAVQNPLEPVRVEDEMTHVENYLLIQSYRQSKMPKIEWDVSSYLKYPMVRLTFQPLIENIFNHAFPDGIKDYHWIRINAKEQGGLFIIEVSDNGVGPGWDVPEDGFALDLLNDNDKAGIGLSNVHRRIQLVYGNEYGLRVSGKKNFGLTIRIIMPLLNLSSEKPLAWEAT